MKEKIKEAAKLWRYSRHPVFLTGAGISAESGIPTFRGSDGLWKNYRAEELATPQAFQRYPKLVWEWYNWRKKIISEKKPNSAHKTAAKMQEIMPDMPIITQNVDGFHKQAGANYVIEMHGNIFETFCFSCGEYSNIDTTSEELPRCKSCPEGLLRPGVVWFNESLRADVIERIYKELNECDLIFVVGTSGIVYPAAGFAASVKSNGGSVIEINIENASRADISLTGKAGEILPQILEAAVTA
ncbi:MAG: NAD-dependent deacylase [Spirochaetia bacterium]|nr:NAD-dependent deacylase [Spirochaetia bacterium]